MGISSATTVAGTTARSIGCKRLRRIETEQAAQARRCRQHLAFRLHDVEFAPRQFRRRPIGIRLPALAGLGIGGRKAGNLLRVVAILDRNRPHAFGAKQLFIGHRHLEQDVVAGRLQTEAPLHNRLLRDQVIEEQFRKLLIPDDAGDRDRSCADRAGPRADVQRLAMNGQHRAGGLLEIAAVVVVIRAGIDAGKQLRRGKLPHGGRFGKPLAGDHQLRIPHAGQPQRAVEINGPRIGPKDRRRCRRPCVGQVIRPYLAEEAWANRAVWPRVWPTHRGQKQRRPPGRCLWQIGWRGAWFATLIRCLGELVLVSTCTGISKALT